MSIHQIMHDLGFEDRKEKRVAVREKCAVLDDAQEARGTILDRSDHGIRFVAEANLPTGATCTVKAGDEAKDYEIKWKRFHEFGAREV